MSPPPLPGLLKKNNHVVIQPEESIGLNYPILFLVHGAKETVKILPKTYSELKAIATRWTKPAFGTPLSLRVPVSWASRAAARGIHGEYLWLFDEQSYKLAKMGLRKLRVEIVNVKPPVGHHPPVARQPAVHRPTPAHNPPPVHKPVVHHPPPARHPPAAHNPRAVHQPSTVYHPPAVHHPSPLPSVYEMNAAFTLERERGKIVTINTICSSHNLDMSRTEDGSLVEGKFKGKLDIIHNFPAHIHKMEFHGTRWKPSPVKCTITIMSPRRQSCEVLVGPLLWEIGATYPLAERVSNGKIKFSLRVHPDGSMEHLASGVVTNALYYEAIPDPTDVEPQDIVPLNSFGMKTRDFILHIEKVLTSLRLPTHVRTSFIINQMPNITAHKYIAYRFMSRRRIEGAIDLSVTHPNTVWTRILLIYRGISENEFVAFCRAGRDEASPDSWKEVYGMKEASEDKRAFRVLETSVLEVD